MKKLFLILTFLLFASTTPKAKTGFEEAIGWGIATAMGATTAVMSVLSIRHNVEKAGSTLFLVLATAVSSGATAHWGYKTVEAAKKKKPEGLKETLESHFRRG